MELNSTPLECGLDLVTHFYQIILAKVTVCNF